MDPNLHNDIECVADGAVLVGGVVVGADPIRAFLISLGMHDGVDPYYLKRSGWPIGNTSGKGGLLIASKRRLVRHIEKLTSGRAA